MPIQDSSTEGALAKILTSKYKHRLQMCMCSCSILLLSWAELPGLFNLVRSDPVVAYNYIEGC